MKMRCSAALLAVFASSAVAAAASSAAFVPPRGEFHHPIIVPRRVGGGVAAAAELRMAADLPVVDGWFIASESILIGTVSNHPDLPDGDHVTTDILLDPDAASSSSAVEGDTVTTKSGTKYVLGKARRHPILNEWRLLANGSVVGTVSAHPIIDDGDIITTSALADPSVVCVRGAVVLTASGSTYELGSKYMLLERKNGKVVAGAATPLKKNGTSKSEAMEQSIHDPAIPLKERERRAKMYFGLSGKTIGYGEYLVVRDARRSTSGKSRIIRAYRADEEGLPHGEVLTVKVSSNAEAMQREDRTYARVSDRRFKGRFVSKIDFLSDAGPDFANQCALILETGEKNLKSTLAERTYLGGLKGQEMRNAATAAAKCIQVMHTSKLVWTDVKVENFVVLPNSEDMSGVVGVDLESAVPRGETPVSYSPEACPPEFAEIFLDGYWEQFVVDYSYDIWSYGMLLYELSTGKSYFAGKKPPSITKALRVPTFQVDTSAIEDQKLRDLIRKCLQRDPKKRPRISQILLSPYLLSKE